jgi:hypothetical protein
MSSGSATAATMMSTPEGFQSYLLRRRGIWRLEKYDSRSDTMKHKEFVATLMRGLAGELIRRGAEHDSTKLESPEKEYFDEYTPKLANCTYGSDEYKRFLAELKPALGHHYANNSHHPEHYPEGIRGMDLIDLAEMAADWYSSSMRHNDGDIIKSIELNKKRFKYDDMLASILRNTVNRYFRENSELDS